MSIELIMEYAVYVAAAVFVVYIVYTVFQGQSAIREGARNKKDDSDSDGDAVAKVIDKLDSRTKDIETSINELGSKSDREDLLSAYQDNVAANLTVATLTMASNKSGFNKQDMQNLQDLINMHKMLKDVIPTALDHIGNEGSASSKVTSGLF